VIRTALADQGDACRASPDPKACGSVTAEPKRKRTRLTVQHKRGELPL